MPQQHVPTPKAKEIQPPTETPRPMPAPLFTQNEPRYDSATVNRVIALAGQMQMQHHQTMSSQDIEGLGKELGIDSVFLRRALAQTQADLQAEATQASATAAKRAVRRQTWVTVTAPIRAPFRAFLAMSLVFPWMFTPRPETNCFYFLLPILLAFGMAMKIKGNKDIGEHQITLGVWQGFWFGAAGLAAFFVTVLVNHLDLPDGESLLIVLMAWLGSGAFAGLMGTSVRNIFDNFVAAKKARQAHDRDT